MSDGALLIPVEGVPASALTDTFTPARAGGARPHDAIDIMAARGRAVLAAADGRIEKIFGTWKRCYGLRRMRWRGLAKAAVQVHLTAIAYNLKRTMNILAAQA